MVMNMNDIRHPCRGAEEIRDATPGMLSPANFRYRSAI
jgi:hypothetical protein